MVEDSSKHMQRIIDEKDFSESLHRWRKALVHLEEIEAELIEHGFLPFTSKIIIGNRITIPLYVMNKLKLKVDDWILLPVFKLSRKEE